MSDSQAIGVCLYIFLNSLFVIYLSIRIDRLENKANKEKEIDV